MSQPTMETISLSKDGSVLGPQPLMMNLVYAPGRFGSASKSSDEGLEAIMKRAPVCSGKQNAASGATWLAAIDHGEPMSLRAKLAEVDSTYSAITAQESGLENGNPQMRNGAAVPSYFRPTSPSNASTSDYLSSPRSSSSSSVVLMGVGYAESLPNAYAERTHAHTFSCADLDSLGLQHTQDEAQMDASSEPGHERQCMSPTQDRRSLSMSTNRPVVSRNHSALKGSCGSSPFRDASCGGGTATKRFHRTKSSGNDLTEALKDPSDHLFPKQLSFED